MQADKPKAKRCARCAVEVTPANWERLASGFLLCRACYLETEPDALARARAVSELRERSAQNPALAALRRACSKGEPIAEEPTPEALAARAEALRALPPKSKRDGSGRQTCRHCDARSVAGLARGSGLCRYHWNAAQFGREWADYCAQ